MGSNEDALNKILAAEPWDAPDVRNLETSLGALERALSDLGQTDESQWSGAAARSAAARFADMSESYGTFKKALGDVRSAITEANAALDRARTGQADLPSATVPSWIHQAVGVAQAAGEVNVVIDGYAYVADKAVGIFEGWLGNNREEQARQTLTTLQQELEAPRGKIAAAKLAMRSRAAQLDTSDGSTDPIGVTPGGTSSPGGGSGGGPYAVPPVTSVPQPYVGATSPNAGGALGHWISTGVEPDPGDVVATSPGGSTGSVGGTSPGGGLLDPGDSSPGGSGEWDYDGAPAVDSGSTGTLGGGGFGAGALAAGSVAGVAGIGLAGRASRTAIAGTSGATPGSGGLLGAAGGPAGSGVSGPARASGPQAGATGARGLARGLSTSGTNAPGGTAGARGIGAPGTSGASGGAAGSGGRGGAGAGGRPMAGTGMRGGSGSGKERGTGAPGLAGYVAPTLDDDDDFTPQPDSARAGERHQD